MMNDYGWCCESSLGRLYHLQYVISAIDYSLGLYHLQYVISAIDLSLGLYHLQYVISAID